MVVSCQICGKQFESFRGLNGHMNAHIPSHLKRAESYKPPSSAVKAAKKGLAQRKEWGRGGLSPSEAKAQGIDSGVTRARKIASGSVSRHDVRRMSAFNRHRKNNRPDKKMPDGGPTAGTIAWNLWGGTSGVNWAKKKSAAMNAENFGAESPDILVLRDNLNTGYVGYLWQFKNAYGTDNLDEIRRIVKSKDELERVPRWNSTEIGAKTISKVKRRKTPLPVDFNWDSQFKDAESFETISGDPWDEGSVADEVYKLLQTHGKIDYWSYRKDDEGYMHFDIILDPLQTELGDFAAESLDYNSFTNDMEDLLFKYSQMVMHYDTEYQSKARGGDGVMKVSVSFIPSDAYFDDVDFDAESFGPVDEEGQLAKALAAVREKSKRYAPTPLRLTKLPHPDQKTLKDFEADWRDLSRDSSGRWLPADDSTVSYDMTDMSWMTPSEYYQYVLEEPLDISDDIEDDTQTIEFQDRFVRYTAMTMLPQVIDALIEENELEIVSNLFADPAEAEGEIAFLKAVKRYQQFSEQYSAE